MVVCGMDECGRGALAGPLVACAIVLKAQYSILRLKDSKQLSIKQRNELYKQIINRAEVVRVEFISARQINNRGMWWANKEIFRKLIRSIRADKYIVDGNLKIKRATSMVKADTKVPEVMAASIVAKVTRDKFMKELHLKYPKYGWQTNVGYGTDHHIRAISEHGSIHYHRSVFVTTALRNGGG